jgi:hypothetical protein
MSSEWRYSDGLARVAIPGVASLIGFLSYSSQYLFSHIEPSPLDRGQTWRFNVLVLCIWISYARACLTDPGRVPAGWHGSEQSEGGDIDHQATARLRYCRKCDAAKLPRSHHCKVCKRYALAIYIFECADDIGACQKWTTIAHGPRIVYLITPGHTSCAFCSTLPTP